MKRLAILAALALAGCGTTKPPEPIIRTVEVRVPVPVPCVIDVLEPVYSDTPEALRAAPDIFERVKLLMAGRMERAEFDNIERAARQACSGR